MNEILIMVIGVLGSLVILLADEADTGWEKFLGCLIIFLSMIALGLGVK